MDPRGHIRELTEDAPLRDDEIELDGSTASVLKQMSVDQRKCYWRSIRQGSSTATAMAKAKKGGA